MTARRLLINLAVGIGAAAAALLLMSLLADDAQPQPISCIDPAMKDKVRAVLLDGLDDALKSRMEHLFEIWMREPDNQQPSRAAVGIRQAIRAYVNSRTFMLQWNPPAC